MKLTHEQVTVIRQKVEESKITIDSLKDDVLDHLCCVVEIMMDRGKNFENAVGDAINDLAPNGLDEIQRETVFLLNSKKIIFMKRLTYTIGLLSSMSFMLGWSFGMLQWLGARELSIFGFLGFVFLYVPLLAFDRYKSNIRWLLSDKLQFILGGVGGLFLAVAILFKIMHLQGADQLLLLGTGWVSSLSILYYVQEINFIKPSHGVPFASIFCKSDIRSSYAPGPDNTFGHSK